MSSLTDYFSLRNSKEYFRNDVFNEHFKIIDFYSYHFGIPRSKIINHFPRFKRYFFNKCRRMANAVVKFYNSRTSFKLTAEELNELYSLLTLEIYQLIDTFNHNISSNFFGYATSKANKVINDYVSTRYQISYESDMSFPDNEENENSIIDISLVEPQLVVSYSINDLTPQDNIKQQKHLIGFVFDYYTQYYPAFEYFYNFFVKFKVPNTQKRRQITKLIWEDKVKEIATLIRNNNFNRFYYADKYKWIRNYVLNSK